MMIINTLSGIKGLSQLFSTHPDTQERIARLEAIARGDMRL
jgi:heat shock protein HtpX